jgi:TonB family protein
MLVLAVAAAAQTVADSAGVTVDTGGAPLLHRTSVPYPESAAAAGIEGTVVVSVRLDGNGEVIDATAVSGPEQLRNTVLQSVLAWHFAQAVANTTRQVSVTFQAAAAGKPHAAIPPPLPAVTEPGVVSLAVYGLSDTARADLLSRLPIRDGDTVSSQEQLQKLLDTVHAFDEHLRTSMSTAISGGLRVTITVPGNSASTGAAFQRPANALSVAGEVQAANLLSKVTPVYPPLAKQARISGTVVLNAFLSAEGKVQNLSVVSGHPLLVQAALDAVQQWVYKPTLLNGNAVPVMTTITVNFTLAE